VAPITPTLNWNSPEWVSLSGFTQRLIALGQSAFNPKPAGPLRANP